MGPVGLDMVERLLAMEMLISALQFECGHFKTANEWLKGRYGEEGVIDWNLDVPAEVAGI